MVMRLPLVPVIQSRRGLDGVYSMVVGGGKGASHPFCRVLDPSSQAFPIYQTGFPRPPANRRKRRVPATYYLSRDIIVYSGVVLRMVHRRAIARVTAASDLLPALLIAVLLLCPGALGFAHRIPPCGPCGPAEIPGLPLMHHGSATDGTEAGHPSDEAPVGAKDSGYFSAVIALSGATLLGLLLGAPPRREAHGRGSLHRWTRPPVVAHYPRGPSPPLLQAFRL